MDYSRPRLADRLACEYVLGTLRGAARRRFDALLPAHPTLRRAVAAWQETLLPLAGSIAPVTPSARVWQAIEARLFGPSPTAAAPAPWWQRLLPWRVAAGLASTAALALAVALAVPPPPTAPVLVVLMPNANASVTSAQLSQARFVASVSADGRGLVLRPLDTLSVDAGRALELWAVPAQGAPRSLGLVASDRSTRLLRDSLLQNTAAFAVSVEPEGGSPSGAPTGPIISVGSLS
ncbi:anti-sigma factor [Ideonella alba]|uniref:Anti-sigma factor n=1 Tax=Ideonella alba TaxID=2824118 RepID=A0A941BC79_9BURK|nr:anti-sigma factor [Ideonella alba]MBQ0928846.1 anti-sigma factor [Ideonella alba]